MNEWPPGLTSLRVMSMTRALDPHVPNCCTVPIPYCESGGKALNVSTCTQSQPASQPADAVASSHSILEPLQHPCHNQRGLRVVWYCACSASAPPSPPHLRRVAGDAHINAGHGAPREVVAQPCVVHLQARPGQTRPDKHAGYCQVPPQPWQRAASLSCPAACQGRKARLPAAARSAQS